MMNSSKSVQIPVGTGTLTLETGLLARQAAGAALARHGDTVVFSAVTRTDQPREDIDYFPLQVEYREKFYAAGKMPGGYFKRESRPTEREVLVARMTDRPIRPLFPENYRNDVQVNNTLLCADGENESDVLSIIAASTALVLSDIPFLGPIGAVRIGRVNGQWVINPTQSMLPQSDLDLVYAGTREKFIMMEGSAKEISEADFLAAMKLAHQEVIKICDAQIELRRMMGLPDKVIEEHPLVPPERLARAWEWVGAALDAAMDMADKRAREERVEQIREELRQRLLEAEPELSPSDIRNVADRLEIEVVRRRVLERGVRVGGRGLDEIRPVYCQVGVLPRTHGSALFMRGETQALATVTLGAHEDAQDLDAIAGGPEEKRFLLHYNFPPYSVGEVGRLGPVGRREIGHGALAERSLRPLMPTDYPYTVRVVVEIMESNGSSSMASVCAGSLALMDAGVPLAKPVAGISIGLFTGPGHEPVLVTDILGTEDHCGDMDFKVAGTRQGITGFQVDLKLRGLDWEITERALEKARVARLKILDVMDSVISAPRPELSPYAPRVEVFKVPVDKIGALIGPGGKNIRRITETYKVEIDVEDDGTVRVYSVSKEGMEAARREIGMLSAEAEVGKTYQGRVTSVKDFGAFVEILPGLEGLVHVSELANFRVKNVEDVCKPGDVMWVKCIHVDENGRIRLSRKAALAERDAVVAAPESDRRVEGSTSPAPQSGPTPSGSAPENVAWSEERPRSSEPFRSESHEHRPHRHFGAGSSRGGRGGGPSRGGNGGHSRGGGRPPHLHR